MDARLVGSLRIMLLTTSPPSKKFQSNYKVISLTGILSNITSGTLAILLRREYWLIQDFEAVWSTQLTWRLAILFKTWHLRRRRKSSRKSNMPCKTQT